MSIQVWNTIDGGKVPQVMGFHGPVEQESQGLAFLDRGFLLIQRSANGKFRVVLADRETKFPDPIIVIPAELIHCGWGKLVHSKSGKLVKAKVVIKQSRMNVPGWMRWYLLRTTVVLPLHRASLQYYKNEKAAAALLLAD